MKKTIFSFFIASLLFFACTEKSVFNDEITIYTQQKGAELASSMYGVFFEEINHAGDGGLYAELVNNRSFEELEMPEGYYAVGNRLFPDKVQNHITGEVKDESFRWTLDPVPAWALEGDAEMVLTKDNPKFETAPNNLRVIINDASNPVKLINNGYWGMAVKEGEVYHLRTIIRPLENYSGKLIVKLYSEKDELLASTEVDISKKNIWNDFKTTIMPSKTDSRAKLVLEFDSEGEVYLDYVSLFPENTFKERENGLRIDLAETLLGLKPAFVRWPGGCVVEGISLANRFEWKKTLGDPAARPGEYSTWGYRCSYGFGYYEFLQLCEDLGADAMFVCNVGMGCQFRMGDASPESEIEFYLNDCMDAIEYAIGDINSKWGSSEQNQDIQTFSSKIC